MSKRYQLSKEDYKKVINAFLWSTLSMLVAGLIAVFADPSVELPVWVGPLIPAINTFLYGMARWLQDNQK